MAMLSLLAVLPACYSGTKGIEGTLSTSSLGIIIYICSKM